MRGSAWLLGAGIAGTLLFGGPHPLARGERARPPSSDVAREHGARRLAVPQERVAVRGPDVVRFEVTRRTAHVYDVADPMTRRSERVVLDDRGREVQLDRLHAEEAEACRAEYGAMEPTLVRHLPSVPPGKPMPLLIWLASPPAPVVRRPADGQRTSNRVDQIVERSNRQLDPIYRHLATPVVQKLQALGHPARHIAGSFLYAELPPELAKRVAHWPEVRGMSLNSRLRWPRFDFLRVHPRR